MGTYLHVPVQLGIIIISVIDIVLRKGSVTTVVPPGTNKARSGTSLKSG